MLSMLVVDDEYLVRMGIRNTIKWDLYGIEITGEASDGDEALELAVKHRPDIILTDIRMPYMDGLEFMGKVRAHGLDSKIIVLSGFDEFDYARAAVESGASAYLLKPVDNGELIDTVQKTAGKIKEERAVSQYYGKLKDELTTIKKQFVADLISGSLSDRSEIEEKIKFLEIPLDLDGNYLAVVQINQYSSINERIPADQVVEFSRRVLQHIADSLILHSKFMGIVVNTVPEEWAVIIHKNSPEPDISGLIKERCVTLTRMVEKEFNETVAIGISGICDDIKNIHNAYLEARNLLSGRLIPNCNYVVSADEDFIGYKKEIKGVIEYIGKNYMKDISVETAANELYISPSYLMHLLKSETGKTFWEWMTQVRMEKAKELLKNPMYKVYEISGLVGYSDPKYFSQIFKRVVGMTPSQFVK